MHSLVRPRRGQIYSIVAFNKALELDTLAMTIQFPLLVRALDQTALLKGTEDTGTTPGGDSFLVEREPLRFLHHLAACKRGGDVVDDALFVLEHRRLGAIVDL
jgi:hypothetical protein